MERRGLVPFEVAAVIAAAVIAATDLLDPIPVIVPLLVVASGARWACRKSFAAVTHGPASYIAIGAGAGLAALVLGLAIGTPIAEALSGRAVVWGAYPLVRANPSVFFTFATVVAAVAIASELVLRGWLVERVLELGGSAAMAVFAGALAEALLIPGPLEARFGGFAVGIGLGAMYIAAGRNVAVTIAVRLAFALGALVLEMLLLVS
jgi:hypothetical protein